MIAVVHIRSDYTDMEVIGPDLGQGNEGIEIISKILLLIAHRSRIIDNKEDIYLLASTLLKDIGIFINQGSFALHGNRK